MAGYSEVLQTMAAMIVFSIILMTSNRLMLRNSHLQVEGELEQETIAVAQDLLEESRTKEFDEVNVQNSLPPVNIPGDFIAPAGLGPDAGETARAHFDDFDDYHGLKDSVITEHGSFHLQATVSYVDPGSSPVPYEAITTRTTFKKLSVTVTNKFLQKNGLGPDSLRTYTFETIRNYYGD